MDGTGIAKRQRYYDSEHDKDSDVERDLHEDPESPRQEKSKRREWSRDNETEKRDSRDRGRISKRYDDRRDRRKDRDVEKEDYRDKGGKYKHDYGKDDKGEVLQDNNDVSKGGNRDKSGKHKYDDKNDRKDSQRDERDAEKGNFIDRSDRYNFDDDRRVKRRDEDDAERWDYKDRVDKQKRNGDGKDHRREKQGDDDDGVEKGDYRDRVDRYSNDDGRAGQRDEDDPSKWDHRDRSDKKKTYIGKKDVRGGRQRDDDDFEKGEYREKYNKYDDEKDDRRERQRDTEIKRDGKQDNGDVHARRVEIGMTNDVKRDGREVLSTVKNPENNTVPDANLGRSGGIYIPPYKLARMMKDIQDKSSIEYQRMTWDALRKSINGLVNKVNATNIKNIIPELFGENLIRGRGLFCRSCMKSQMASPGFTDVFAALVSVVNTKFPEIGDLLLRRIILQFQRAYKRNDKPQLLAAVKFIAHLVNQQLVHELIALELLALLLEKATDDSVEVAVGFVTECGAILQDLSPRGLNAIFDRFRGILTEGQIDMRVQFLIESLFGLRRAKFQDHPAVRPELDLVEEEDQLTHEVSLSDEIDPEIALDIFKPDPQFTENEKHYEELRKQMLGEESDDNNASDAEQDSDDDNEEDESEEEEEKMKIKDETETNLINLRRTIYLTIMSSATYEEAGHKLLSIKLEPGQEMELCIMLLECCSQERTYLRFYGLIGGTLCMKKKIYQENFDMCFVQQYSMIHRLETNKLRNVAKFFGHLLGTDKLPWHVLSYIRLTEEDTTSSSRIFIKILFQEMSEHLGIRQLNERLNDPSMQESFESIFPKDNPKNTRFSINFFTSIGLGGITESLREYLKNMPRLIMQQQQMAAVSESDDTSDSDSDESGSSSLSESNHQKRKRRRRSR